MTQNQIPNQYSNNPTAPGTTPNVTGSAAINPAFFSPMNVRKIPMPAAVAIAIKRLALKIRGEVSAPS